MSTLRSSLVAAFSLVLASTVVGCAGKDTSQPSSSVESSTDAATSFSKSWKIVGSLDYGQTSASVAYTHTPKYRAFKFAGNEGDVVDIWVRSKNGGDAMAWLLDDDFKQLAANDDADKTTYDSHIHATLSANASATHYIVFRDADLWNASFTVELSGTKKAVDFFSCKADADCVAVVPVGCCHNGLEIAVNKKEADAYEASFTCPQAHPICPLYVIKETRVAECNTGTGQCEMVQPGDIECGGFTTNAHKCTAGYQCKLNHIPDVPGTCEKRCGGIAGLPCDAGYTCVDDPSDSCDPANGGSDCGGLCEIQAQPKTCGGIAGIPCDAGYTCVDNPNDGCDPAKGGADCGGICQKSTCVETQLCVQGAHWDSTACSCVANSCVQTVFCTTTSHWDNVACKCVPN